MDINSVGLSSPSYSNKIENLWITQIKPILEKINDIACAILPYMPISGTVIGIYHACTIKGKTDIWQKAKIMVEIFSFLIIPQIIYLALEHHFNMNDDIHNGLMNTEDQIGIDEVD
jgi:hypothetical protein